jgi:two-component system sensor histidine kinase AlgZ
MSIPSLPPAPRLPDFRNLGVWLRVLLAANAFMLIVALAGNRLPARFADEVLELASWVEPALLMTLLVLFALTPALRRMPVRLAGWLVVLVAVTVTVVWDGLMGRLFGVPMGWRTPLGVAFLAVFLLAWFDLQTRAHAPALTEARLQALTARIRPHFLFNSLNAVLGVMRDDPRRAETALEELAELFRALMRENRDLRPLSEEIALARKYLDIERLRLGERLQVSWAVSDCPDDLLVPPLLLQPLLENAVHHGIEPAGEPGEIRIRIATDRTGVILAIDNPWLGEVAARSGNQMALENLRERLLLFYDLEARLTTDVRDGRYSVHLYLPKRKASPK